MRKADSTCRKEEGEEDEPATEWQKGKSRIKIGAIPS